MGHLLPCLGGSPLLGTAPVANRVAWGAVASACGAPVRSWGWAIYSPVWGGVLFWARHRWQTESPGGQWLPPVAPPSVHGDGPSTPLFGGESSSGHGTGGKQSRLGGSRFRLWRPRPFMGMGHLLPCLGGSPLLGTAPVANRVAWGAVASACGAPVRSWGWAIYSPVWGGVLFWALHRWQTES